MGFGWFGSHVIVYLDLFAWNTGYGSVSRCMKSKNVESQFSIITFFKKFVMENFEVVGGWISL